MPTDPLTLLLWLLPAALAIAALAWWLRNRNPLTQAPVQVTVAEPAALNPPHALDTQWGRECKIAIGSAGIKSIVREGRMEEAYQVRSASDFGPLANGREGPTGDTGSRIDLRRRGPTGGAADADMGPLDRSESIPILIVFP